MSSAAPQITKYKFEWARAIANGELFQGQLAGPEATSGGLPGYPSANQVQYHKYLHNFTPGFKL